MRAIHTIEMRCEQHGRQLDAIIRKLNSDHQSPARDRDEEVLEQPFENLEDFEKFDAGLGTNGRLKTSLVRHTLHVLLGEEADNMAFFFSRCTNWLVSAAQLQHQLPGESWRPL